MSKLYCRMYQHVMKIALYFLPWKLPEVIEGPGAMQQLAMLIKEKQYKKVLIVTGQKIAKLHLPDNMLAALEKEDIGYLLFHEVTVNPSDVEVEQGVVLYHQHHCEAIIAFGGGSPMDCAKAIGARIAKPDKSIAQLQGLFKVLKPIPTIFAVPTTAGTGSETTFAAVITNTQTHHKAAINDLALMPKYAVLDPELTAGLPPAVTAITGMDALCHAVEAYTNHTYNTRLENDLCKQAVKLIYDNLYLAYQEGSNLQARQQMQQAAFYAGRAFTRGSVGYVHAIGHALSGLYGTPHGLTMAILLPLVMKQYGSAVYTELADLCDVCNITASEETNKTKAEAFISWIEEMNRKMGIPPYPPILKKQDIEQIATWANQEGNPLYPTPVVWSTADFKNFILSLQPQET